MFPFCFTLWNSLQHARAIWLLFMCFIHGDNWFIDLHMELDAKLFQPHRVQLPHAYQCLISFASFLFCFLSHYFNVCFYELTLIYRWWWIMLQDILSICSMKIVLSASIFNYTPDNISRRCALTRAPPWWRMIIYCAWLRHYHCHV